MEELIYMILRGLIIGVVVSAPMGPVGIFCIQRTLDKGRSSGFYTGVGAAISDLIYCLLTGFGLSFIEEFINSHRYPIQLLGSIVLIAFGIWLIRKKSDSNIAADPDHDNPSIEGDILKGFALTFSNPLILFLIIGLFAQFNFVIEGMKFYHYLLGFIGIIGGALGWWWIVTYFVDKIRVRFNRRTMKLINTTVGIIIFIFAAVGIFSSAASLMAAPVAPPSLVGKRVSVEFRVADNAMKGWDADVSDSLGNGFLLEVRPIQCRDPFGDSSIDALSLRAVALPSGREIATSVVSEGVDPYKGPNAWKFVQADDIWIVFVGNREYRNVMTLTAPSLFDADVNIIGKADDKPVVSAFKIENLSHALLSHVSDDVVESLLEGKYRQAGISGVYSLFDFEHDDSYARLGGAYRIGIVPSVADGMFDIVYLGGAKVFPDFWKYGMIKGQLRAAPFANVYDVTWIDAEGQEMANDLQADFDPLAHTLTIRFPYQNSSMRFRKE